MDVSFRGKTQFMRVVKDLEEKDLERYRFLTSTDSNEKDITSDIKEPVTFYRKRDFAVIKEIAQYKYEANKKVLEMTNKKANMPKPIFYHHPAVAAIEAQDSKTRVNNSLNNSFLGLETIHERAFKSSEKSLILEEYMSDDKVKDNNRSQFHYLDAHRDGMAKRRSKTKLPKLKEKRTEVTQFKVKPIKNPLYLPIENEKFLPIENTPENKLLLDMSKGRDFSHLNLWSKISEVKRHYNRVRMDKKRRRLLEKQQRLEEIFREGEDEDLLPTASGEVAISEAPIVVDSDSEDEETKVRQEQEIIEKVLAMRHSKAGVREAALVRKSVLHSNRSSTAKIEKSEVGHLTPKIMTPKKNLSKGVSFIVPPINPSNSENRRGSDHSVREKDHEIYVEASDIVLDLPQSTTRNEHDALKESELSDSFASPGMTRAQHHQANLKKKIMDYEKYKIKFDNQYVHQDSSNKLRLEYELTRPLNQRHFRNLIDEPQYLRKKREELKKLEEESKAVMNETLEKTSLELSLINQQNGGNAHDHSILDSVIEYRAKKKQSTLQNIAERSLHHFNNGAKDRAGHNFNTFKRRKMGPEVTDAAFSQILHQISIDISKL